LPEVPDFGHRITIRHLIHHTSGLRDQWQLLSLSGWRPDDPKSEADILWLVGRQRALNFVPGSEHLYSNTGYTLMGTIVQRVSGKSLRQFTTERIFGPLGMMSTHFHDDHAMIVPGRTSAYQLRPGRAAGGATARLDDFAISIPVFDNAGATSLFTTVQDLAKWEANFLQPQVGDTATLRQMYERGRLTDGREIPYAFALTHGQFRGLNTIGHGGADAGYRADFLRLPDQRHAFIAMCNIASANPGALTRSMAEVVLGDRMTAVQAGAPAMTPTVAKPIDAALLRTLAGPYLDPKTEELRTIVYRDNTKALHPDAPNAPALVHIGDSVFTLTGPTGQVTRMRITTHGMTDLRSSVTFLRMPAAVTERDKLSEFAGRYRSEELDVDWTIALSEQGALMLSRRRVPAQRMMPSYADGFASPPGSMRFTRDASGRVTGFLLTAGRIRHVRFDRVDQGR
jgi:CubicO group peptidase (beta-lactamase class C family)